MSVSDLLYRLLSCSRPSGRAPGASFQSFFQSLKVKNQAGKARAAEASASPAFGYFAYCFGSRSNFCLQDAEQK